MHRHKPCSSGGRLAPKTYSIFDYYDGPNGTGTIYHSAWEPDGLTCTATMGGEGDFDPGPYTGGGGAPAGLQVSPGVWVNQATKTVTTIHLNCTATLGTTEPFAAQYWDGGPLADTNDEITMRGTDGASWRHKLLRKDGAGPFQKVRMIAGGTCNP